MNEDKDSLSREPTDPDVKAEGKAPQEPEAGASQTGRKGVGCGGCAFAIVFAVVFVGYVLAGFQSTPNAAIAPKVIDSANLLAEETVQRIAALQLPRDVPLLVRTVEKIPAAQIGAFATDGMDEEKLWSSMRPRGFLRRIFRQDRADSTGVYVLISRRPALLQIRFGRKLRLAAYAGGLACGEWYLAQQRIDPDQPDRQVLQTLTELTSRLAAATQLSWFGRKSRALASIAWSDFEDFLMPSDNFLVDEALKTYIRMVEFVGGTGSVWKFLLATAGYYVALWLLLKKVLIDRYVLPRLKLAGARIGVQVGTEAALAGFLATGLAALIVLGRGRIEDQMALEYLGLSGLGNLAFNPALFSQPGGLWFAVPVAVLVFLRDLVHHNIVKNQPGASMLPLGFLGWAAVFYLMPRAICFFALGIVILRTASTLVAAATADGS